MHEMSYTKMQGKQEKNKKYTYFMLKYDLEIKMLLNQFIQVFTFHRFKYYFEAIGRLSNSKGLNLESQI